MQPGDDLPLYPLRFHPIYKQKVWGGRKLEQLGRQLPGAPDAPEGRIGESWELADLATTAVSGGGGDAEYSTVAAGPLAGRSIRDLTARYGQQLLGGLPLTPAGGFPLLVKFLDASENLSVQVHPSPDYAARHPDAHLKSEAWYIVDAEPDAAIYKGIAEGVSPADFRAAVEANDADAVEQMLIRVPVKPGDCHYLPSGTCHALGAGVLVAEVQTPSDTTFRVFDWGRTGRQLHIDQAMQCIHFGPAETASFEKRSHVAGVHTTITRLAACEFFAIEKVRMTEGYQQALPYDQPVVWIVLEGAGKLHPGKQGVDPVEFAAGQTLLIPAHSEEARVQIDADSTWLEITFPQIMPTQIA